MTVAQIIVLALQVSIAAIMFALGLKTVPSTWVWLLRRPGLLARCLIAMNVIMPLFAIAAIETMNLRRPVAIALVALSLSPVPPLLHRRQARAGGAEPYAVDLLVIASLLAIIWIPFAVEVIERIFGLPLAVSPWAVVKIVGLMILIPLLAGTAVRHFAEGLADRIEPMVAKAANVVLLIGVILILVKFWRAVLAEVGDGTLIALIAFIIVGLVAGHLLGGSDVAGSRRVLAIATATRHPGMAIVIARLNFPDEHAVPAAVLLYMLVAALISLPYVIWRKRAGAPADSV
jgi:BASS family bile acid:Na+ symporter